MKRLREKEISSVVKRLKTIKEKIASTILPQDVIILILSKLPVKSIIRFRCVCKLWLERFKSNDFIMMHLNHAIENNKYNVFLTAPWSSHYLQLPRYYRIDFNGASASSLSDKAVKIDLPIFTSRGCIGSCNGIFCFIKYILFGSVIFSLWNPSTQEFKEIVYEKPYNGDVVAYGFGYDRKIDDFKLILIFNKQNSIIDSSNFCEIHVYTLGSSSWRNIGNTPCVDNMNSMKLLNGAMHWITEKVIVTHDDHRAVTTVIVSFDIAEETTKEIQLPSCLLDERYRLRNKRVGVLGKDLYFAFHVSDSVSENFELWVMKDYGVVDSWTKLLSLDETGNIYIQEVLLSSNNNRQILMDCSRWEGKYYKRALVSYDLENESLTFSEIKNMPIRFTSETFIGSLVSLASAR